MIFLQILRLLAVMVLAFGAGKLASKLKMPVILGWLIAGMVLGPHALNLLDQQTLDAAWFGSVEHLLECVAGLIIGTELLWKKLRSAGRQILVTTVTESLGTFAVVSLVFACVFRITGVPVYLAFLFGGIVLATAPAPSLSIVNELKTNGPVTRTLMPMAALDDLVGATVFFVVVALVSAQISSVGIPVAGILVLVFLPVPLGGAMGFWAGCRMCRARTPAPGLWYHAGPACSHRRTGRAGKCASAGSCAELHAAGHVLFRGICQLHSRRPSGKHHACDESRHRGGADCGHFEPGCAAGLSSDFRRGDLYCHILARAVGKYSGAYLGAAVTGAPKTVRNFLGFALLPHSGVSLVFTGIAVSVLSGPAPECASILQGPLRQPRSSMRSLRCSWRKKASSGRANCPAPERKCRHDPAGTPGPQPGQNF